MKSVLMPDEQSHWKQKPQEQLHILPPPQELSLENISPKWASRLKREIFQPLCHQLGYNGVINYKRPLHVL